MQITNIKPNKANPRIIKNDQFKKLVQSLTDFPEMMALRPIIVDADNVIQGGNMRYRALLELGYKEIPDEWVKQGKDLTPDQWREFVIKDNVGFGEWDFDLLANDYDTNELINWGLEMPDYSIVDEEPEESEKKPDAESLAVIIVCESKEDQERKIMLLSTQGFACHVGTVKDNGKGKVSL